jgi:hypothetical protein
VQYQSSEQNKVDIATEVTDKGKLPLTLLHSFTLPSSHTSVEGKHTKSSKNWNPDLASNSEEVVHAERKEAKKNHSVEEMQQKSVRNVQQREKKLENVDRKEVEDK